MAHRYFKTQKEAQLAAEQLRQAGLQGDLGIMIYPVAALGGYTLTAWLSQVEFDAILSRPD